MTWKCTGVSGEGGGRPTTPKRLQTLQNRGFAQYRQRHKEAQNIRNSSVQNWGVYGFENGVLMLRNITTPFLNALDVRHRVVILGQSLCLTK